MISNAAERFSELQMQSQPYIDRAQRLARYALPFEFPPDGLITYPHVHATDDIESPAQSLIARGIQHLSAKVLETLFPTSLPFFRLAVPEAARSVLAEQQQLTAVEDQLSNIERSIMRALNAMNYRPAAQAAIIQLLMTGNALFYIAEDGVKVYKLFDYVVRRDGMGHVQEIITRDMVSYVDLPDNAKKAINKQGQSYSKDDDEEIPVYTWIMWDGDGYTVRQEAMNVRVGRKEHYAEDELPWIVLRYARNDGEDYGRGHLERYEGDIATYDSLMRSFKSFGELASMVLYLVNPDGVTEITDLVGKRTGDFALGRMEDVNCLQVNKLSDMQVVLQGLENLEQRLGAVFMLDSTIQQDKDRQTATEIRTMVLALNRSLGSVYSLQTSEWQIPLCKVILAKLIEQDAIPDIREMVEPTVTAGLAALSREEDLEKLNVLLQYLSALPGASNYIKPRAMITMIGASLGIDAKELLKTDNEVAQEQQQAMMQQMMQQAAGPAAQVISRQYAGG